MIEAQTEWVKPEEFPDLRQADTIARDLETHDPDLKTLGSGSIVGRGKVVGIDPFRLCFKHYLVLSLVCLIDS